MGGIRIVNEFHVLTPPIKLVEVHGAEGDREWTDFLLADEGAREFDVMAGLAPIYCQVGNAVIADDFVRRVNAHDGLVAALADTLRILEAVKLSAGLGTKQIARVEAAKVLLNGTEQPAAEPVTDHASTSPGPVNCQVRLRAQGMPYPRTCERCGLGRCPFFGPDGKAIYVERAR